ncbi:orotidine-5'-phosphate decarboxylase [Desulfobacterales bacterium HSG16]|nr:orotidine-5'-phosphate decarboxylase [Desulfobacterales bacterium HSG16]
MKKAKDYIIFPLDVPTREEAKRYVNLLAGHVGMFKVGLELFIRTGPDFIKYIKDHGDAGIFLDLKLHDIPATVCRAMQSIADTGVDLATVHCGGSRAMLEAAVKGAAGRVRILGVTVLTSIGTEDLKDAGFKDKWVENIPGLVQKRAAMAKAAGCAGIVCSGMEAASVKNACGKEFVTVTPGIRPLWDGIEPDDQQRVTTPAQAVEGGSDYLVIGRPIRDAEEPDKAALQIAQEIESVI